MLALTYEFFYIALATEPAAIRGALIGSPWRWSWSCYLYLYCNQWSFFLCHVACDVCLYYYFNLFYVFEREAEVFLSVVHCSVQATAESEPSQSLELELHFDLPCGSRSPRTWAVTWCLECVLVRSWIGSGASIWTQELLFGTVGIPGGDLSAVPKTCTVYCLNWFYKGSPPQIGELCYE